MPLVLDLGCGPGATTLPLRAVGRAVVGVDASAHMIAAAARAEHVHYVVGALPSLPFESASFPLVCSTQTLEFVPWDAFFDEASRVLAPEGSLVVYSASSSLCGSAPLTDWFSGEFARRFPAPPGLEPRSESSVHPDLRFEGREAFSDSLALTPSSLKRLLLSWESVLAAITSGREDVVDARAWIGRSVDRCLGDRESSIELRWTRVIRYFRRAG